MTVLRDPRVRDPVGYRCAPSNVAIDRKTRFLSLQTAPGPSRGRRLWFATARAVRVFP